MNQAGLFQNRFCFSGLLWLSMLLTFSAAGQESYQVRMAMIGNSITYGSGLPSPGTQNFAAQLDNLLSNTYGDTVDVRNYGVSGRTLLRDTDKSIWKEFKFRQALEFVPDVCVILLGTNDSKPDYWSAYGTNFLNDYLHLIDTFQFRNPNTTFIVCYPPPIFPDAPYDHSNTTLENEIIPLIDSVVTLTGAQLVDFHYAFADSVHLFPDKLHPDTTGAGYMAEMLYDTLQKMNLMESVETGLTYVSSFKQIPAPVELGTDVTLQWVTLFADSVFLDGSPVDVNGSAEVEAEDRVYILTAKSTSNTASFPLQLQTEPSTVAVTTPEIENIALFPNPANNRLAFTLPAGAGTENIHIVVYDLKGEQMLEQRRLAGDSGFFMLDLYHLPAGMYELLVLSGDNQYRGRFLKQ